MTHDLIFICIRRDICQLLPLRLGDDPQLIRDRILLLVNGSRRRLSLMLFEPPIITSSTSRRWRHSERAINGRVWQVVNPVIKVYLWVDIGDLNDLFSKRQLGFSSLIIVHIQLGLSNIPEFAWN